MGRAVAEYMVMGMTDAEKHWVQSQLGNDASTNFEGLNEVDAWYAVDRGNHVEVMPVVGLEAMEPSRDGFVIDGDWDEVATELIRSGFPMTDFE